MRFWSFYRRGDRIRSTYYKHGHISYIHRSLNDEWPKTWWKLEFTHSVQRGLGFSQRTTSSSTRSVLISRACSHHPRSRNAFFGSVISIMFDYEIVCVLRFRFICTLWIVTMFFFVRNRISRRSDVIICVDRERVNERCRPRCYLHSNVYQTPQKYKYAFISNMVLVWIRTNVIRSLTICLCRDWSLFNMNFKSVSNAFEGWIPDEGRPGRSVWATGVSRNFRSIPEIFLRWHFWWEEFQSPSGAFLDDAGHFSCEYPLRKFRTDLKLNSAIRYWTYTTI